MLDDWLELHDPAPQCGRVPLGELRERVHCPVEIGPPLERPPVRQDQGDIQLGLEIDGPVPVQFQVAVPGHHRDGPVEERMGIVPKAGRRGFSIVARPPPAWWARSRLSTRRPHREGKPAKPVRCDPFRG